MNEDRKKRGLAHSKFLTVVAMSALFLSSGNVMATQVASCLLYTSPSPRD